MSTFLIFGRNSLITSRPSRLQVQGDTMVITQIVRRPRILDLEPLDHSPFHFSLKNTSCLKNFPKTTDLLLKQTKLAKEGQIVEIVIVPVVPGINPDDFGIYGGEDEEKTPLNPPDTPR